MKFAGYVSVLLFVATLPLSAQVRPGGTPNRAALQRQIIERIIANYANQAGLTDEQLTRVRQAVASSFTAQREVEARQRQLILSLERQLRPGVAANEDSLATLITALTENRQAMVDLRKRNQEEYAAFLDPVQQAQLVLMLERFSRQVENQLRRRLRGSPQRPVG